MTTVLSCELCFLSFVKGLTSKTSMDGWWMVQQIVRPVLQIFLTTLHMAIMKGSALLVWDLGGKGRRILRMQFENKTPSALQ